MNKKSWPIVLGALVLGAGAALAITQGTQEDGPIAAAPTETADTGGQAPEGSKEKSRESKDDKGAEDADDDEVTEQQVQQTVNTYVEAAAAGDTEAVCDIQAESLTVELTASGETADEIAMACTQAASELDYPALFAAFARDLDADDVQVRIDGSSAEASLPSGLSFSLDQTKSGDWKIDGLRVADGDAERPVPSAPGGGDASSRHNVPSDANRSSGGGNLASGHDAPGGGVELPSPQVPQSPQLPQR